MGYVLFLGSDHVKTVAILEISAKRGKRRKGGGGDGGRRRRDDW